MAWNFMCNVDRVELDVVNKRAYLHLPKDNVPDGRSTIANISGADPEVEVICLLCAGIPQGFYVKGPTKWEYRGYAQ